VDLREMARWLIDKGVRSVAMQSTGAYCLSVFEVLEQHGLEVYLVNARHTKNLPGRKSDVQECQWLMKLHTYGLLRDSFRLEENMERVRTIWRLRDRHVKDSSRAVQHMQKALTKMNIQLANVISDISGFSGQTIIAAILKGERDPLKLADLKHDLVRASREEVARSLEGNWREDLLFELRQAVDSFHFAHRQMAECDRLLKRFLAALPTRTLPIPHPVPEAGTRIPARKPRKTRKPRRNDPSIDLKGELQRICGVDLTSIDGIDVVTAQTIISEIGTEVSAFPTENHFASWLGLTPSKDISGGRVVGPGRRIVQNRVATALRMGATTLLNSKSYLGARYRHLRKQLPSRAAAIKAMARTLAVLVYRLLAHGQAWVDRGAARFEQRHTELELARLNSNARAKGFRLVPITEAN
jgi:transposase